MNFQQALASFLEHAEAITIDRNVYNQKVEIPDYFIHGYTDLLYELHKKVVRADNHLSAGATNEQMLEHFTDLHNYSRIAGAITMMRIHGIPDPGQLAFEFPTPIPEIDLNERDARGLWKYPAPHQRGYAQ